MIYTVLSPLLKLSKASSSVVSCSKRPNVCLLRWLQSAYCLFVQRVGITPGFCSGHYLLSLHSSRWGAYSLQWLQPPSLCQWPQNLCLQSWPRYMLWSSGSACLQEMPLHELPSTRTHLVPHLSQRAFLQTTFSQQNRNLGVIFAFFLLFNPLEPLYYQFLF